MEICLRTISRMLPSLIFILAISSFLRGAVRCHDVVDMGWSTLADLSIHEGKILGCSYHESRVRAWVADIRMLNRHSQTVKQIQSCQRSGCSTWKDAISS